VVGQGITSWKFAGSIPNGVIGIFQCPYLSSNTLALWLIQPVVKMSIVNIFWGVNAAGA